MKYKITFYDEDWTPIEAPLIKESSDLEQVWDEAIMHGEKIMLDGEFDKINIEVEDESGLISTLKV